MTATPQTASVSSLRILVFYVTLLVAGVCLFFVVRSIGERLEAPGVAAGTQGGVPASGTRRGVGHEGEVNVVLHVLTTLAAVIALGNVLSYFLKFSGQPPVIGEVIAGILLGPSVLGGISPEAMHWLIPGVDVDPERHVLVALKTIASLGVVLYMFLIGLELNTHKLKHQAHAAIAISHASIVIPFLLGSILALWLYPKLSDASISFTSFALFQGVAMSITAFPVLARILSDRKLDKTDVGIVALGCAASDDVTAWCLLAFVVGVTQSQINDAIMVAVWTGVFLGVMFFAVRPLIVRLSHWSDRQEAIGLPVAALFVAVLTAAVTTEAIGIHAVFGPFLLGAIIPHDSKIAKELGHRLHDVTTVLILPAFFAITGINTRIGLIDGMENWLICLVIILVATAGKFGGTLVAARWTGHDWRTASALGVLMNTRGLMELIVLNIGLGLGVISPKLFAMMVIMAIVTTMITAPVLARLIPESERQPV